MADTAPTDLPDHVYDLVLLLQQAAEDALRYERFADDARAVGDDALEQWLLELAATDRDVVKKARSMLAARL